MSAQLKSLWTSQFSVFVHVICSSPLLFFSLCTTINSSLLRVIVTFLIIIVPVKIKLYSSRFQYWILYWHYCDQNRNLVLLPMTNRTLYYLWWHLYSHTSLNRIISSSIELETSIIAINTLMKRYFLSQCRNLKYWILIMYWHHCDESHSLILQHTPIYDWSYR